MTNRTARAMTSDETTSQASRNVARKLSLRKKAFFALLSTFGFFIVLELVLAAVGVQPVGYVEDPYVGFSAYLPLFVEKKESDGRTYMETAANKLTWFNEQRFPKKKPGDVYRIFCLGGSTTYGRPYDDTTSFCGWLRELLPQADPSRRWEVINAGGISYASYRVAKLMEELIRDEPDLFIIYSGHNEFLERRTYGSLMKSPAVVRTAGGLLSHTRTFSLLQRVLDPSTRKPSAHDPGRYVLPGEVEAVLDKSVGPDSFTRNDELKRKILAHYRFNLQRMVAIGRSAGAEMIFVTPASNLRDSTPFKSENRTGLTDAEFQQWRRLFDQAVQQLDAYDWEQALKTLDAAARMDDRYAHLHYLRGRALWELGRFDEAKAAFVRARDEDVCPLRALSSMQKIVAEVAAEQHVPLVDFAALIEQHAKQGIPGKTLFLDHVHPTIAGNRLLAVAILDAMSKNGIVTYAPTWNSASVQRIAERVERRIDRRAHGLALCNLSKVLGWAGKGEESARLALEAVELIPEEADAQYEAGNACLQFRRREEAVRHYQQALRLKPNVPYYYYSLGVAMHEQGHLDKAAVNYREALRLDPQFAPAHYNLGNVYSTEGRLSQAADHFQRALRINPNQADCWNNLGLVYARRGELKQAEVAFRKALEVNPHYAPARANLQRVLQQGASALPAGSVTEPPRP